MFHFILSCSCQQPFEDPLVLTLDGSPIRLTNVGEGVLFDVDGNGQLEQIAWTRAGSGAAFLGLDLDGDGAITTGDELLGMPAGAPRRHKPAAGDNSFTLLAAYDTPAQGGNGDGAISAADAVFGRLRLWTDANHDGVSQPNELVPLSAAGITSVELTYRTTGRRDGLGNFYRYRGIVHLQSGRAVPIWDVFLATAGSSVPAACSRPEPGPFAPAPEWSDGGEPFVAEAPVGGPVASRLDEIDPPPPASERVEYYHLDTLGSVRAVTDAQGQVVARHDFLPFGEEWFGTTGGPGTNPVDAKLFTGKERDAELDLDYFGARYYRADIGRFTTIDPVYTWQENLQDPQRWNRYTYARNNPLRYVDPDGRVIDTIFDIGFVVYDLYKLANEGSSKGNWGALAADVGAILVPGVTGAGLAVRGAAKAGKAAEAAVYVARRAEDVVQYVGITNNVARRAAEHAASKGIEIGTLKGLEGLSRADARAVEQTLIEIHKLGKDGGTLLNKINSIAKTNDKYADALRRGYDLLKEAGYAVK